MNISGAGKRRFARGAARLITAVILWAPGAALADTVDVTIKGLDGELLENAEASLTVLQPGAEAILLWLICLIFVLPGMHELHHLTTT